MFPKNSLHRMTLAWGLCLVAVAAQGESVSLLKDTHFQKGFILSASSTAQVPLEIGWLAPSATCAETPENRPEWRLAQWGTNHLLVPGRWTGTAMNPAKTLCWQAPEGEPGRLLLEVQANVETGGQPRKSGEAWPHLLIEQNFVPSLEVVEWATLEFHLRFKVIDAIARTGEGNDLDPGLHTAQATAYWMLEGPSPEQGGETDKLWFGIPLFDARYPIPPGNQAPDQGQPEASGIFIYVAEGARFFQTPTGDKEWHEVGADILPLLREAVTAAHSNGFWKKGEIEGSRLTSFNLGWEVPGPYKASLEISELAFEGSPLSP
jgi:hypothetical protein